MKGRTAIDGRRDSAARCRARPSNAVWISLARSGRSSVSPFPDRDIVGQLSPDLGVQPLGFGRGRDIEFGGENLTAKLILVVRRADTILKTCTTA